MSTRRPKAPLGLNPPTPPSPCGPDLPPLLDVVVDHPAPVRRKLPNERAGVTHAFVMVGNSTSNAPTIIAPVEAAVSRLEAMLGPNDPEIWRYAVGNLRAVVDQLRKQLEAPSDVKGYITASVYPEDGRVGEFFVKIDKQGSLVSGFADAWAIAMSMLLQYGVPIEKLIGKYKGAYFEPSGFTNNDEIRIAKSVVDYVVRWLEKKFVPKEDSST